MNRLRALERRSGSPCLCWLVLKTSVHPRASTFVWSNGLNYPETRAETEVYYQFRHRRPIAEMFDEVKTPKGWVMSDIYCVGGSRGGRTSVFESTSPCND
jgi:hypothetical protein